MLKAIKSSYNEYMDGYKLGISISKEMISNGTVSKRRAFLNLLLNWVISIPVLLWNTITTPIFMFTKHREMLSFCWSANLGNIILTPYSFYLIFKS